MTMADDAEPGGADAQLAALADPTRRQIFELVATEPSTVRAVTDRVPVSQSAVSQHLKVLREAGLVVGMARGASTVYRADRSGLARVRDWVDRFWDDALDAFAEAAEREEQP